MASEEIERLRKEIEAEVAHIKEPLFVDTPTRGGGARHLFACFISQGDWDAYAIGYKKAGDLLIQWIDENDYDQDYLVLRLLTWFRI